MLEYKCSHAGVVFGIVNEAYTTVTCSVCKKRTGPNGQEGCQSPPPTNAEIKIALRPKGWGYKIRWSISQQWLSLYENGKPCLDRIYFALHPWRSQVLRLNPPRLPGGEVLVALKKGMNSGCFLHHER